MAKSKDLQKKTIDSFQKLDEHISLLTYYNDYKLEKLLNRGCKSTVDLLAFMVKELNKGEGVEDIKVKNNDFACSSFDAVTPDGGHIMGRNFDYMDAPLIVVWTAPKKGYKSISVANCTFMLYGKKAMEDLKGSKKNRLLFAPYCAMDGINEKGLAISILEIKTKATSQKEAGKKDITTTTIIRTVLDKCATVDEAVIEFKKYNMHDAIFTNYHFHLTDASGASVIIEYVNNEIRVIKEETAGKQRLTNFFISEDGDNAKAFGRDRFDYMKKMQEDHNGILTEGQAMKLLENARLDYKHRRGYMIISLWSAVYNSKDSSMTLCAGLDYERVYKFNINKPGEVEKLSREQVELEDFDFSHKDKEMDNWDVNKKD